MNQTRSFLLFAWLLVAFLLFMEWSKSITATAPAIENTTTRVATNAPNKTAALPSVPSANISESSLPTLAPAASEISQAVQMISIKTDVLKLQVDPRGADAGWG